MKKEELIALGIDEEVASKVMELNGKDIQREQNKFADYEDLKSSLADTKQQLEALQGLKPEEMQQQIASLKEQLETSQAESAKKIAEMETTGKVKDFLTSKKFVNALTKDAITTQLVNALATDESKGKSLDDIFENLTKDMQNILVDDNAPKPPVQTNMTGTPSADDDAAVRAVMGLPPAK